MSHAPEYNFERLKYLFFRYLDYEVREKILVDLELMPKPVLATPHVLEHKFIEQAMVKNKMPELWDMTMPHVPESSRKPNPFKEEKHVMQLYFARSDNIQLCIDKMQRHFGAKFLYSITVPERMSENIKHQLNIFLSTEQELERFMKDEQLKVIYQRHAN